MLKRIILAIVLVIFIVCVIQFVKETALSNPKRIAKNLASKYEGLRDLNIRKIVYSPRREVRLQLSYMNIFSLAEAKLYIQDVSFTRLKIIAQAETRGFAGLFYKAKAEAISFIDKSELYPYKYIENLYYSGKEKTKEIVFNRLNNTAVRGEHKYKVSPRVFCPISAFYYLQSQDLRVGSIHQIELLSKEEIYVLEVEVLAKQDDIIKLSGQVRRKDLSSKHGARFDLWMSDSLRVPLLLKIKTQAGLIVARAR